MTYTVGAGVAVLVLKSFLLDVVGPRGRRPQSLAVARKADRAHATVMWDYWKRIRSDGLQPDQGLLRHCKP